MLDVNVYPSSRPTNPQMDVRRVLPALLVVLGVVAIGAAAAGVDGPLEPRSVDGADGSSGGAGEGEGPGGNDFDAGEGSVGSIGGVFPTWIGPWFLRIGAGLLTVGAVVLVAVATWRDGFAYLLRILRNSVYQVVGAVIATVGYVLLIWFGFDLSERRSDSPGQASDPAAPGGSDPAREVSQGLPDLLLVAGAAVVLALATLAVVRWLRSSDADDEPALASDEDDADESATGSRPAVEPVHGPADPPPENGVYRAWRDLVARVDPVGDPSRTPGEVADAAVADGLDDDAVARLTDVFAEVRYGDRPATEDRERRARSALESTEDAGGEP